MYFTESVTHEFTIYYEPTQIDYTQAAADKIIYPVDSFALLTESLCLTSTLAVHKKAAFPKREHSPSPRGIKHAVFPSYLLLTLHNYYSKNERMGEHVFLTSALVKCEGSASSPSRFTPGKEPPVPIG
jgi:hypothetical protein